MDTGAIKIKISRKRLLALYGAYTCVMTDYEPCNAHEVLLQQHAIELYGQIGKIIRKDSQRNTLKISGTQALAFCQLWQYQSEDHYTNTIINEITAAIDQYRKSPLRLIPELQ